MHKVAVAGSATAGKWVGGLTVWVPRQGPGIGKFLPTITYSTETPPWRRGFPLVSPKPKPDFAHHLFDQFILHLRHELIATVDYVVADQFGSINGRFHQHAILAGMGLERYSRKTIWQWLHERAGWSRILPFEEGASSYISRYIGRDANRCEWQVNIGWPRAPILKPPVGKVVVVESAALTRECFKNSRTDRKR